MTTRSLQSTNQPDELTKRGEEIYRTQLKDRLEKTHLGDYVVIEVKSKRHFVDADLVQAVEKAKKEFPHELFFIVQIGKLQTSSVAHQQKSYAWFL